MRKDLAHRRWVALVALATLGLATSVLPGCGAGDDRDGAADRPSTSIGVTTTTAAPLADVVVDTGVPATDEALEAVARRVEEERGLRFTEPVAVQVLPPDGFSARLGESLAADRAEAERAGRLLVLTGEVPAGTDFVGISTQLALASVIGFYDPRDRTLLVSGDPAAPGSRVIAAHELTHALDDQWFDLGAEVRDDDARVARAALAEGSADRVEEAFVDSLEPAERARAAAQLSGGPTTIDLTKVPPQMWEGLEDLYGMGDTFVARLLRSGGPAELDAAFDRTDLTTREVLHADADETPPAVPAPATEGTVVDEGVLGELGLLNLLATALPPAAAREAAAGWDGDRYVIADTGGGTCLRLDVRLDGDSTDRSVRALERWAAAGGDRSIARSDGLAQVRSCL